MISIPDLRSALGRAAGMGVDGRLTGVFIPIFFHCASGLDLGHGEKVFLDDLQTGTCGVRAMARVAWCGNLCSLPAAARCLAERLLHARPTSCFAYPKVFLVR